MEQGGLGRELRIEDRGSKDPDAVLRPPSSILDEDRKAAQAPLTIVGWLWHQSGCHTTYTIEHANTWARMIDRHLTILHRFILLTDRFDERFDPLIEALPLWSDWRGLKRLSWSRTAAFCYTRLKAFSAEMREILGERFVSIDLDCLALDCLDPLFERDEDFLIIRRPPLGKYEQKLGNYQASMWMMSAGARKQVWEEFKGHESIVLARDYIGSDQAWLNYTLKKDESGWSAADGVYNFLNLYRDRSCKAAPPKNARLIFFNGPIKPWEFLDGRRQDYQWIAKNYH